MKNTWEDELDMEYTPAYRCYDDRETSFRVREGNIRFMLFLFVLLGALVSSSILLMFITEKSIVVYGLLVIIHFIGKWGTIIGWPIWLAIEIYAVVLSYREKHHRGQ